MTENPTEKALAEAGAQLAANARSYARGKSGSVSLSRALTKWDNAIAAWNTRPPAGDGEAVAASVGRP